MNKLKELKKTLEERVPSAHFKMDISGEVYPSQKKENPKCCYAFKCDIPIDLKTTAKALTLLLGTALLFRK